MDRNTSFQCRHCEQDFDQYRDLFEHVQQRHSLLQTVGHDVSTRDLNKTLPIPSTSENDSQLKSTLLSDVFTTNKYLKRHKQNIQVSKTMDRNTSFQCRHCGQDFDKYRDNIIHWYKLEDETYLHET